MSIDEINIAKYLIIIELFILFFSNALGGRSALFWAVIATSIIFSLGFIFLLSMGSHAVPTSVITRTTFRVILVCTFLGLGIAALYSENKIYSIIGYIWLVIVCVSVVRLFVLSIVNDPVYLEEKKFREERRHHEKHLKEKEQYKAELSLISLQYENALKNISDVDKFISYAKKTAEQYKNTHNAASDIDAYMLNLMLGYLEKEEYKFARIILNRYLDDILPFIELVDNRENMASLGLYISIKLNDDEVFERVKVELLGDNFKADELSSPTLLFNFACYYSLRQDKKHTLLYIKLARKQGVLPESFLNDSDFIHYLNDVDFLNTLKIE